MERNKSGSLSIASDVVTQTAKNLLMGSSAFRRWRLKRPRTAAGHSDIDEFLKHYAFASLDLLLEHSGDLHGRSVCEIGPGDYLTSGLSILAAGAERYCVIDRFPGDYFGEVARHWYREIAVNWHRFYPHLAWDPSVDASGFPESAASRLEIIGQPLERARPSRNYDLVCSFQVGEHVSDINSFAEIHNSVLKQHGIGLHRVDFGPHDCWFLYRDPGVFLRFSDTVWRLMGSNRGTPNRKRHHEFLDAFDRAGLDVEVLSTEDFDRSLMDMDRLNERFLKIPMETVLTGTAVYKITKR
jgi:hypothetical protein